MLDLMASGLGLAIVQASLQRIAPPGVRLRPLPKQFSLRLDIHAVSGSAPNALARQLLALLPAAG
ncbi:hypothetical protein [Variovorax terrae]|uniref:LysR substrate-binding domain-containing protein n=1 Tax=Variovorax terrae TaxID=2923278 RepID=A0A9X1W1K8_9BURK|nr:hypothetical protein [Variovorax terrae]MCJ0766082.1 hypothetical protein [Variovorax terrae]